MQMQTITLCPDYTSCKLVVGKRQTKKGIYYSVSYYVGLKKKCMSGYFTEEELNSIVEEGEKEKNNFHGRFEINKNELTEDIIRRFRYVEPFIHFEHQKVLLDPYILGIWLGDGHSSGPTLTNIDNPIIDAWKQYGETLGLHSTVHNIKNRDSNNINKDIDETAFVASYHLAKPVKDKTIKEVNFVKNGDGEFICTKCNKPFDTYQDIWHHSQNYLNCDINDYTGIHNIFNEYLKIYSLLNNKHIPIEYLKNSEEVRLKLLAGLIDTDGSLEKGRYEITQKNKQLADNIVELCRSLGFYTRMKEVKKGCMYKGEKKIGTYYRIAISLNQFSKEVPVLLERKKWKYDREHIINVCNPFIDIEGNILCRSETNIAWTEDMKIKLYSIVEKIKEMQPNNALDWNIIKQLFGEFDERVQESTNRAFDTMYSKTLLPNKDEYDSKKINVQITEYQLIDVEWRKSYEIAKESLDNNVLITRENNETLYSWLYKGTLLDNNMGPHQKKLWDDLIEKQRNIANNIEMRDWKNSYDELVSYIEQNKKTPIEGTELGNWFKLQKRNVTNNCGIICIDPFKKQLWEQLLSKYEDINTSNRCKSIKVIFPNKDTKIFKSQNDAIEAIGLGLTKGIVQNRRKSKKDFKGHYFEEV